MYRRVIAGVAAWLLIVIGGGAVLLRHDTQVEWLTPLRFAGVDTVYALRRLAAHSGLLLALDEANPRARLGDLNFRRVDVDLGPAPLFGMLDRLQAHTGGWDYRVSDGVVYVRSRTVEPGLLDERSLPAGRLEADLEGLLTWLREQDPKISLRSLKVRGLPVFRRVELDVPEGSSPIDVLLLYARAAKTGWHIRRAGYVEGREGLMAIHASSISIWREFDRMLNLPHDREKESAARVLAQADARGPEAICVFDRSILGTNLGNLDVSGALYDTGLSVKDTLQAIGFDPQGDPTFYLFKWVSPKAALVQSRGFLALARRDALLDERLVGGRFSGTLAELARWINENRVEPSSRSLLGGEIDASLPSATLEIPRGATVRDALVGFAEATGVGWQYIVLDRELEFDRRTLPDFAWHGAWVSSNLEWAEEPELSYQ